MKASQTAAAAREAEAAARHPGAAKAPDRHRPPELEDFLNARLYHPLARRLARLLARTPVTPNAVSVAGGAAVLAAGFIYAGFPGWAGILVGFLVHASWHVLDGADGDLARLTGKTSPLGEMIDGACDYVSHGLLYVVLATMADDVFGIWVWIAGWIAGPSRALQANHAESRRRTYLWRVYGVPWLKQTYEKEGGTVVRPGLFARLIEPFARFYVRVAGAGNTPGDRVDALIEQAASDPAATERARRICREESHIPLRLQKLLGANLRTPLLAACIAAGSPLWFFLLEATFFNLLLAASVVTQRRCDRRIAERIEANAALLGG